MGGWDGGRGPAWSEQVYKTGIEGSRKGLKEGWREEGSYRARAEVEKGRSGARVEVEQGQKWRESRSEERVEVQ